MGSVHKFQRPPKNKQQFSGDRPTPRRGLRPWQKSVVAWTLLIGLAVGLWALGRIL